MVPIATRGFTRLCVSQGERVESRSENKLEKDNYDSLEFYGFCELDQALDSH